VADDKIENRLVLLNMLEPLGFRITLVENGQELVDQTLALRPDLIVTDLIMPVLTGIEAIQSIRQQPGFEALPIIAMSASVFAADLEQSQVAGANAFLPKPVELETLLALLAQYLKLTWQYKAEATPNKVGPESGQEQWVAPPAEVLDRLLQLARFGDMDQIQIEAKALANRDQQYALFAERLVDLARRFEDQKIVVLIEAELRGE
jgi:CheY-like chemotaxis protein